MQNNLQTKVGIEVEIEAKAELVNMTASTDLMKEKGATVLLTTASSTGVSMVILGLLCVLQ